MKWYVIIEVEKGGRKEELSRRTTKGGKLGGGDVVVQ